MTITDLRERWLHDIDRCDAAIKLFAGLSEYTVGIRQGKPTAIATQRYIEQLTAHAAELRELLFAYKPEDGEAQ